MEDQVISAFLEPTEDVVLLETIKIFLKEREGRHLFASPLDEPVICDRIRSWIETGTKAQKALGGN